MYHIKATTVDENNTTREMFVQWLTFNVVVKVLIKVIKHGCPGNSYR